MKLRETLNKKLIDDEIWIQHCNQCGSENEVTWKQAVNDRSPCCGTFEIQIYSKKTNEKEQSKREV